MEVALLEDEKFKDFRLMLDHSLNSLLQEKEKLVAFHSEKEMKKKQLKEEAEQLSQHITEEFSRLHRFLTMEEESLHLQLKEDLEVELQTIHQHLEVASKTQTKLDGAIAKVEMYLRCLTSELLQDCKSLLESLDSIFEGQYKTETVIDLPGKYSGPLQYAVWKKMKTIIHPDIEHLTFDPKTANRWLSLSDDLRSVRESNVEQNLPDNSERFDVYLQVTSSQGFQSGQHYWEVEVGDRVNWVVGAVRESACRKGYGIQKPEAGFWTIRCCNNKYYMADDSPPVVFKVNECPKKIGIYLDHERGMLSFYSAGPMVHLYTFHHSFTETVYPFFCPCSNEGATAMRLFHLRL
ncbi:E3 ubiquitin-protein ligase TRIM69-like [Protopterus annectens]|uniref:E3 ubiquitin-protein ligase TRIM69-like n=1 Tax=Protopterus annectens TaxID=7888 RepID=UPI001CFB5FB9|nr:E3 ubiquitin-protein ligase TRIM69-like [Protopterus annectens]